MGLGLDPQPDGLTAGLAGHCQPDKKYPLSQKEKEMICATASRETISHPQLQCCQNKKRLRLQCKSLGLSPTSTISELFFESPSQMAYF